MEITGKIIAVLPANSGVSARTGNPWMSQEYVLETHDQFPRKCCFRILVKTGSSSSTYRLEKN